MNRILYGLGAALLACVPVAAYADEGAEADKPAATQKAPTRWEQLKQRYDLDKDGRITWEEYRKVQSGFTALDQDGDGVISKKDAEKLPAAPGMEQLQALFGKLGNGQGFRGLQGPGGFPGMAGAPQGGLQGLSQLLPLLQALGQGQGFGPQMGGGFPGMGGGFGPQMGGGSPFGGMRGFGGRSPFGMQGPMMGGFPRTGGGFPGQMGGGFPGMGGGNPFGNAQGGPDLAKLLEAAKKQAAAGKQGGDAKAAPAGLGSLLQGGAPTMFGAKPAGMAVAIASQQADADKDGTLTKAEWSAWLKTLDADEKGAVSKKKLATLLPEQARSMGAMLLAPMFDHDGNGTIEIADFDAAWKAADKDGDGSVVIKDLMPAGAMGNPFGK